MTTIKAEQISDAMLVANVARQNALTLDNEKGKQIAEIFQRIYKSLELDQFFNELFPSERAAEDCTIEAKDEFDAACLRFIESRISDTTLMRQARFVLEHQDENTVLARE